MVGLRCGGVVELVEEGLTVPPALSDVETKTSEAARAAEHEDKRLGDRVRTKLTQRRLTFDFRSWQVAGVSCDCLEALIL